MMTWVLELGRDEVGFLKCHLCLDTYVTYVVKQDTLSSTKIGLTFAFLTIRPWISTSYLDTSKIAHPCGENTLKWSS